MKKRFYIVIPIGLICGFFLLAGGFYYTVTPKEYSLDDEISGDSNYFNLVEEALSQPSEVYGINSMNISKFHPDQYQLYYAQLVSKNRQVDFTYNLTYMHYLEANVTYQGGSIRLNNETIGGEFFPKQIWVNNTFSGYEDTVIPIEGSTVQNFSFEHSLHVSLAVHLYYTNILDFYGSEIDYHIDIFIAAADGSVIMLFYMESEVILI